MAGEAEVNFRDLLQQVEGALYAGEDVDCAAFLATLQRAKPAFLNLLRYKEPNAESRAAVQSGKPVTPAGPVVLDQEPDVREVLLLADEMKLDELLAVLCVQGALQETGEVSAAAGAGIYFEERRGLLTSLWLLLQAQVISAESLPADLYRAVCAFNADLLSQSLGGRTMLVQRLAELVRDNQLEAQPGSRLPVVIDSHGREVDRNALVQREQTVLCECLVYACCIRQRVAPSDISDLVDLQHRLALKARAGGGADLAAVQQAYVVLLAVLLTLLPLENAEGADVEADERALRELAGAQDLDQKIGGGGTTDDPHWAVLKLGWGVLLSQYGPEHAARRAVDLVKAATQGGACAFLRTGVLESVPMQDDADHQRELYASVAHQLTMAYLMSPAGRESSEALSDLSMSQGQEEVAASAAPAAPAAGTLMAVDTAQAAVPASKPDNLASLLCLLAAVYTMHPDLFLDDNLRYEVFGEFMEGVAGSPALLASPSVFVAYLEVLTALAAGEKGARSMYTQLRGDDRFAQVNWRRMFQLLLTVVRQYVPEDGSQAGGAAGGSTGAGAMQQRLNDYVLPACDSKAICAYLALFKRVMSEGRVEEVVTWLRQLEEEAGVAPVWEVLFQAMCCPVPQELKAALDGAIASLARRADLAAALWERLTAAVVVQPSTADNPAVPRYDLSYQLNEIEARSEDYCEAVAFVRLLNALWRGGGGSGGGAAPLADDGRSVAHFTKFVRDDLLGTAFQRVYKEERQRWELVAACLEHCELSVASLRSVASLAGEAASSTAVKPPGLEVLLDLLGERNAMRAAMATCIMEVDRLAYERHSSPFGGVKEAAVLAALRLLRVALERDLELVSAMRQASHSAPYESLDAVLRHDRRRIPLLLDYVRYPHNPALQAEAVRIATHLAERIPNLVPLLLNSPSTGAVPAVQRLQDGFAACLQSSLFNMAASVALEEDAAGGAGDAEGEGDEDSGDPRAALVLQLLLTSLEQPAPNFTHLLCGFDFDSGMGPVYLPDPRAQYNVLRVLLSAVLSPGLSTRKPALFEQCLELLYELAASADTGIAMLDLLRGYYAMLAPLLDSVACAPLPDGPVQRASSLHQRAWLLQLQALELHRADVALGPHSESVEALLAHLFALDAPDASEGGMGQGRSRMVDLLELLTDATPAEPQLGRDAHPEVRRMLQALELDSLLSAGATVQQGGVRTVSTRGVGLFDVLALKDELLKRYNEWVARHGGASEALKEACRLALQYAQQYNAYVEQLAGQGALLAAWQAVLLVAFTRRFEQLATAAGGGSPTDLVLQMAEECLRVLVVLVSGPSATLAPALCEAVQALLARLQEQVSAATTADPLGGMPLPARCHDLLALLLEVAWQGRKLDAVRLPMYSALASYLTMCRGPALLRAPPVVVQALLDGMPAGSSAASQLDALQSQLEEGNAALLHEAAPVLELLAADAVSSEPAQSTSALTALCSILAADPTGGCADELYRSSLPARVLAELQVAPHRALTQPPPRGQALLLVVEAQLTLLLRLALAGPPAARSASAQKLFGLHALAKLSQCRAIDLQPEEPGFGQYTGSASLRQRLHQLLTPLLRLVLATVTALPSSSAVREQALAFVEAHGRTLTRVLHDAASPGIRGWEPGDAELEEATLVLQLLAELAPVQHLMQAGPQLQEAAYRLSARFLCLSSKSPSPVVGRLHAARDTGRLTHRDERTYLRVLSLRCALSHYLLQLSADPRSPVLFRCTASSGGGRAGGMDAAAGLVPTLFLVKDALLQAVLEDMPELLGDEPLLLDALRAGDAADGAELAMAAAAAMAASPGRGAGAGRARLARAAANAGGQLSKLLYLTEHLLALLYTHLRLALPAPALGSASPDKGMLALTANGGGEEGQSGLQALGSERDLDQLRRLMEPIVMQLERATGGASLAGRDVASLALLVRRTKEYLSML